MDFSEGKKMPLDKKKIDELLEDIKKLDTNEVKIKNSRPKQIVGNVIKEEFPLKKDHLLSTEKKTYFYISHFFKLTLLSINDTAIALEIWIKAILPLLLQRHGIDLDEWERICDIGDHNSMLEEEQDKSWLKFFNKTVKNGHIDREILVLINEGKNRVKKMREES